MLAEVLTESAFQPVTAIKLECDLALSAVL